MPKKYQEINKKTLNRVAKIARLSLNEKEKEAFLKELNEVLEAFKKIEKIETKKTKPAFHPIELKNRMRKDKVREWDWNPLKNTEHREKDYFKGPKIG